MNFKNSWVWVAIAGALFALVCFERQIRERHSGPIKILPALKPADVTSIRVRPGQAPEILAERTNGQWRLVQPIEYPAVSEPIEALLAALEQLHRTTFISEQELKDHPAADREYGFDARLAHLTIDHAGGGQSQVTIGSRTALGDEVFLQVVGDGKVYVVDAALLKWLPAGASDWRDRSLADFANLMCDRLIVTNAGKVLELQRNPGTRLWRMIEPQEARADNEKIKLALLQLLKLRAEQFIADGTNAELEAYGLAPPEFSLTFKEGTNTTLRLDLGKSPTNNPALVYARRADKDTVVAVPKSLFEPWMASPREFFDRLLFSLTAVPDTIEVRSAGEFSLVRQADNSWRIQPEDSPADAQLMDRLLVTLATFKSSHMAQDVVSDPLLPNFGLAPTSACRVVLRSSDPANPTNQLDFGIVTTNVFARRAGEKFVWAVDPKDYELLAELISHGWKLRDRRIWNFTEHDVTGVTVRHNGRTREIHRRGTNDWSLAPGSQGVINDLAIEEIVRQLGQLAAVFWTQPGGEDRAKYGFTENSYQVELQLKNGDKLKLEFGGSAPSGFPLALTTVQNRPWIFEFPFPLRDLMQVHLPVPADP